MLVEKVKEILRVLREDCRVAKYDVTTVVCCDDALPSLIEWNHRPMFWDVPINTHVRAGV